MDKRRQNVPFDPFYFERKKESGEELSMQKTFSEIHHNNHWKGKESVSGEGSSREQTDVLCTVLPDLIRKYDITSILDLPCGDFSWMRHLDLPVSSYIGADIVPELIARNNNKYANRKRRFMSLDLTTDPLPEADLLLCRDCLVHFSLEDIHQALVNIQAHNITYILTTTFPLCQLNEDITTGDWRPINLQAEPFNLPEPLCTISEQCTEGEGTYRDKSLALWKVSHVL